MQMRPPPEYSEDADSERCSSHFSYKHSAVHSLAGLCEAPGCAGPDELVRRQQDRVLAGHVDRQVRAGGGVVPARPRAMAPQDAREAVDAGGLLQRSFAWEALQRTEQCSASVIKALPYLAPLRPVAATARRNAAGARQGRPRRHDPEQGPRGLVAATPDQPSFRSKHVADPLDFIGHQKVYSDSPAASSASSRSR
jgi:hypothetical protein